MPNLLIATNDTADLAKKQAYLQTIVNKTDNETLRILSELVQKPTACETLKKKEGFIKTFL
ncbi:MAG: hypothetical protein V4538_01780 [Bacteroidota bacterium]